MLRSSYDSAGPSYAIVSVASAHAREVIQDSLMSIDTASELCSAQRLEVEITDADATHVAQ